MAITRRSAAAKGKFLQTAVSQALACVTGLTTDDFPTAKGGIRERDVRASAEGRRRWPIHAECKNHRTLALPQWIRQAERDAEEEGLGLVPALVFKVHGFSEPFITLRLTGMFELLFGPLSSTTVAKVRQIFARTSASPTSESPPRPIKKRRGFVWKDKQWKRSSPV